MMSKSTKWPRSRGMMMKSNTPATTHLRACTVEEKTVEN